MYPFNIFFEEITFVTFVSARTAQSRITIYKVHFVKILEIGKVIYLMLCNSQLNELITNTTKEN